MINGQTGYNHALLMVFTYAGPSHVLLASHGMAITSSGAYIILQIP